MRIIYGRLKCLLFSVIWCSLFTVHCCHRFSSCLCPSLSLSLYHPPHVHIFSTLLYLNRFNTKVSEFAIQLNIQIEQKRTKKKVNNNKRWVQMVPGTFHLDEILKSLWSYKSNRYTTNHSCMACIFQVCLHQNIYIFGLLRVKQKDVFVIRIQFIVQRSLYYVYVFGSLFITLFSHSIAFSGINPMLWFT